MGDIELVIKVPEALVCAGFERPFTEEERNILIRAIGNGTPLPKGHTEEDVTRLLSLEQEPKTGHWIYDNFNWRCSECNETPKTMGYVGTADFMTEHFKFCNHCGAKMVVEQESEG